MTNKISSLQNEKIKNLAKLRGSKQEREKQGLFLIEGEREINLALAAGIRIKNLFYCPDYGGQEPEIKDYKIIEVPPKVFAKISYRENPDGFLAVAAINRRKLADIKLSANPLLVILESVEKPGNLGAILRSAGAAGADAVIINDAKTDFYNSNVIRASQGAVFTVPAVISLASETRKFCRANKIKIFAAAPAAEKSYAAADYSGASAILLGAEDKGLSNLWLKAADEKISIAMRGKIDSLNVSVSAAVILFEAVRQRDNLSRQAILSRSDRV